MAATEWVDYYALLGVEIEAPLQQLSKSYRQLSLKVHPDRVRFVLSLSDISILLQCRFPYVARM